MEELMTLFDSYQPLADLYHSTYYPSSLFSLVEKPKALNPKVSYTLEVVDDDYANEPGLTYQVDFLNLIFIAKLRTWVTKKRIGKVLKDINTQQYAEFVANVNKVKIRVESTRISFEAKGDDDLKEILKEIATLIYSNYSNITLRIQCTDKARQTLLEKILDEAYLAVEKQKARQRYQFFTVPFNDLTGCNLQPSAPPLEPDDNFLAA
jgi:hypothetical protein